MTVFDSFTISFLFNLCFIMGFFLGGGVFKERILFVKLFIYWLCLFPFKFRVLCLLSQFVSKLLHY